MMWWDVDSGMGWWMLFESIPFVLFWVGAIALALWVASGFRSESAGGRDPIDVAKEHYARGEISREQFQQITEDLRKAA